MRVRCKYSNATFVVPGFSGLDLTNHHPIFDVDFIRLNQYAQGWYGYDETEQRLLFLAMLKITGAVEFRVPASPSIQTVQRSMDLLLSTVIWQNKVRNSVSLPGFRVTRDNYTLPNIKTFLYRWRDIEDEWNNKTRDEQLSEYIRRQEEIYSNRVKRGLKSLSTLIRLGLSATNAPKAVQEHWTGLFSLRTDKFEDKQKIWNIPYEDLDQMYQHFLKYADIATSWAPELLNQCRALLNTNKLGIQYSLMELPTDIQAAEADKVKMFNDSPFTIMKKADKSNVVEWSGPNKDNSNLPSMAEILAGINDEDDNDEEELAIMRPEAKPTPAMFTKSANPNVDFIRANARWERMQREAKWHNEAVLARRAKRREIDTNYALGIDDAASEVDPMEDLRNRIRVVRSSEE